MSPYTELTHYTYAYSRDLIQPCPPGLQFTLKHYYYYYYGKKLLVRGGLIQPPPPPFEISMK